MVVRIGQFVQVKMQAIDFRDREYFLEQSDAARQIIKEQAIIFILEAIKHVPVWSGQSQAAFIPFAQKLGVFSELSLGSPVAQRGGKPYDMTDTGLRYSRSRLPAATTIFRFSFDFANAVGITTRGTYVPYFALNDQFNMNSAMKGRLKNRTPWRSFEQGERAAENKFDQLARKYLPNPKFFFRTSTVGGKFVRILK